HFLRNGRAFEKTERRPCMKLDVHFFLVQSTNAATRAAAAANRKIPAQTNSSAENRKKPDTRRAAATDSAPESSPSNEHSHSPQPNQCAQHFAPWVQPSSQNQSPDPTRHDPSHLPATIRPSCATAPTLQSHPRASR